MDYYDIRRWRCCVGVLWLDVAMETTTTQAPTDARKTVIVPLSKTARTENARLLSVAKTVTVGTVTHVTREPQSASSLSIVRKKTRVVVVKTSTAKSTRFAKRKSVSRSHL